MPAAVGLTCRLKTVENLNQSWRPPMTLVIAGFDQATRRAVRTLSQAVEHRPFFVATEGEQLAGDHRAVVWQRAGTGWGTTRH